MFFGFFWGDWTMIVLLPAMIFAIWAQINVQSTFDKYARIRNARGISGAEAARRVLDREGLYHVRIERVAGHLSDHYDPREEVIRLSEATYDNKSAAAVGVATHEAGHAIQHATGYAPLKLRAAIIPVTRIGSGLAMPLFLIGLMLSYTTYFGEVGIIGDIFMMVGILFFSFSTVFQLVTLPTEFNASKRALTVLDESGILSGDDLKSAGKVLNAAALTYVAALATSLASLLRLILIFGDSGRRRD